MKLDPNSLRSLAKTCSAKGQGRLEERADVMEYLLEQGHPELAEAIARSTHVKGKEKK